MATYFNKRSCRMHVSLNTNSTTENTLTFRGNTAISHSSMSISQLGTINPELSFSLPAAMNDISVMYTCF